MFFFFSRGTEGRDIDLRPGSLRREAPTPRRRFWSEGVEKGISEHIGHGARCVLRREEIWTRGLVALSLE